MEAIKFHNKVIKLDLSKNLVPIKFIVEINKKCYDNNEHGDDKLVPRLKKEFKQIKQIREKKADLNKYQTDLR